MTPVDELADYPTWHRFPGAAPDVNDAIAHLSLNPGRIWTDKTIFANDAEAEDANVDHDLDIADDEMAITLSALGTTRQVRALRNVVAAAPGAPAPDPCAGGDPDSCRQTEHLVPGWQLGKTSNPASGSEVQPGAVITYRLRAVNNGPVDIAPTVTDDLSNVLLHANLVEPLPSGVTRSGNTLTWQVPNLAPGQEASIEYRVQVLVGAYDATLRNVASPGEAGTCPDGCATVHTSAADSGGVTPPAPTPTPTPRPPVPLPPDPDLPGTGASGTLTIIQFAVGLLAVGLFLERRQRIRRS